MTVETVMSCERRGKSEASCGLKELAMLTDGLLANIVFTGVLGKVNGLYIANNISSAAYLCQLPDDLS